MVHALRRARRHVRDDGVVILMQPHQHKRVRIAIAASRSRQPVTELINPLFQPQIDGANTAIHRVIDEGFFTRMATSHHQFKVRLANPTEMDDYLGQGLRPPRFPKGDRQRFRALWKTRPAGARIEATEFMTVISLRPRSGKQ